PAPGLPGLLRQRLGRHAGAGPSGGGEFSARRGVYRLTRIGVALSVLLARRTRVGAWHVDRSWSRTGWKSVLRPSAPVGGGRRFDDASDRRRRGRTTSTGDGL